MIGSLLAALAFWMLICVWCGLRARFSWLIVALVSGFSLTIVWVVMLLGADPLSPDALMRFSAALLYACASFGLGWIAGRFVRGWQASWIGA